MKRSMETLGLGLVLVFAVSFAFLLTRNGPDSRDLTNAADAGEGAERRIVSVNGGLTEILFALGAGDEIVGRDQTSIYPAAAESIPDVGPHMSLSAEGILALRPTLVLGPDAIRPPELQVQLTGAGVDVRLLPVVPTAEGARQKILDVAALVGRELEAAKLIQAMDADLAALREKIDALGDRPRPRVLCLYLRGTQMAFLMGENTGSVGLVKLAGGDICLPGLMEPKPMNAEAVVAAQPDAILVFDHGLESVGGVEGLLGLPGIAQTQAGKNRRIIAMDGLLMSNFGPRTGKAALQLHSALFEHEGCYPPELK